MTEPKQISLDIEVYPATADRWEDLEILFGPRGAYAGCWCMFWRLDRRDFKKLKGEGTKAVLKEMTCRDEVPGLLAYAGGKPAGWCSVGPRQDYAALENSRILRRVDDLPVWSVVCFFVARPYRNQGVMTALLNGAIEFARGKGAIVIEGYPVDTETGLIAGKTLTGFSGYMGIASVFREAGFVEVQQASETQRIMRYTIET